MTKTAFIGLGVMGYPMAGHLKKAGHEVTVYNRTASKAEQWVQEFGGMKAFTPEEAAKDADFVMACVGNDDDLREITCGANGAFSGMKQGAVFIDHTTVSAKVTRELAEIAGGKGFSFLDAPISGGQAGAEGNRRERRQHGEALRLPPVQPEERGDGHGHGDADGGPRQHRPLHLGARGAARGLQVVVVVRVDAERAERFCVVHCTVAHAAAVARVVVVDARTLYQTRTVGRPVGSPDLDSTQEWTRSYPSREASLSRVSRRVKNVTLLRKMC